MERYGYVLGLWDGHDAGAALVRDESVVAAVNEERLTRRKLEIRFPENSIRACLAFAGLGPRDVENVAVSTSDFSKTLARLYPGLKEQYYLIRRRKKAPGMFVALKKRAKYKLTEIGYNPVTKYLSGRSVRHALARMGFGRCKIFLVDHHLCHASAAAFFSGADPCLVITVDGIGDALSGTVSTFRDGRLERTATVSGKHSPGIFFEHVTNLLNMRELEDEGKVMALANYAYPIPDRENPLLDFIRVDGMRLSCTYGTLRMYDELRCILWRYPSEQFAYMAQRTLEVKLSELVRNCVRATGIRRVALSGGVFSNIKVNMRLRLLPEVSSCYVFPHMGDGGLALGAACTLNHNLYGVSGYALEGLGWGPEYTDDQILSALRAAGVGYTRCEHVEAETARLLCAGNIVFWFQGRMEYGPRALGNRSILALPDSARIKDMLNLQLKMRVWYQPFCPSMLEEDAAYYLEDFDGLENRFMTMGYMVKEPLRDELAGVISIDGSCRPHIVARDGSRFSEMLAVLKKERGRGVVLNTSFNVHGDPMVCSPDGALATLKKTGNDYLVMGSYLVTAKRS